VIAGVYLSVGLSTRLQKKLQADLAEIFREGSIWPSLEVIRFWRWSGSASDDEFISHTCSYEDSRI